MTRRTAEATVIFTIDEGDMLSFTIEGDGISHEQLIKGFFGAADAMIQGAIADAITNKEVPLLPDAPLELQEHYAAVEARRLGIGIYSDMALRFAFGAGMDL